MKNNIKLLDCTLRDGGYVNDWNFGHDNLISIFERLVDASVDIIEIGFLDERRPFDINKSIMPNTDCIEKIYGGSERGRAMIVGMIDYGTCGLSNIKPCSESFIDGIRVIFKKHLRKEALAFCGKLKELGYKVFAQLVSVTSYSDEELGDLISLANEVEPYAVSMVDTYGLMHQNNLMHYFTLLNSGLSPEIGLGYHAHNNFQMGYANCIAMISNKIQRTIVVDGSLYGMGKSAGNAPIELIAMYLNEKFDTGYQISQMLEAIDANISQFYSPATWGYNMFYYLAASNECHPNYVTYLMSKRTLSVKSVNEILGRLQGEKKLLYDKSYIEKMYSNYQNREINDSIARSQIASILSGKNILLIGPGKSIYKERQKVDDYIKNKNPVIVSINFIPRDIEPGFIFLSNSKRYIQLATELNTKSYPIIATSNVTCMHGQFAYSLNVSSLLDFDTEIIDISLVMFLKVLESMGIKKVAFAGFDGYSCNDNNYCRAEMEYDFIKSRAEYLNKYITDFIRLFSDKIEIEFITESKYTKDLEV